MSDEEKYNTKTATFNGSLPLLNMGQMIEFLYSKKTINNFHTLDNCMECNKCQGWHVVYNGFTIEEKELCDALWTCVKNELEK
jgi:hypothetical protein